MLSGARRFTSTASGRLLGDPDRTRGLAVPSRKNRLFSTEADLGSGVESGMAGGGFNASSTVVDKNISNGFLDGFLPPGDMYIRNKIYKDIYDHDPIAGTATDILSMIPFSDFTLKGIKDHSVLDTYADCCDALRLKILLPSLSKDYLAMGKFIGSMFFDSEKKYFTAIMPQNVQYCDIQEVPILGFDPLVNLKVPPNLKKFINKGDPRVKRLIETMPEDFKAFMNQGSVPLQPENTLYIPRRGLSNDSIGTSLYERMMMWFLLEKTLARGTLDMAQRRQRGILHIVVSGSDDFVASPNDLENIKQLFATADADPTGAIIVTRDGINASEVAEGGCLAGDTLIPTDKGLIKIEDMVPYNHKVLKPGDSIDIDTKVLGRYGKYEKAHKWFFSGYKDIYKVSTYSNTEISSTKDHKYLILRDGAELVETRLSNCEVGDVLVRIVKDTAINTVDAPGINKNIAFLLGAFLSDGHIYEKSIRLQTVDAGFRDMVVRNITEGLQVTPSVKPYSGRPGPIKGIHYNAQDGWTIAINNKNIVTMFDKIGFPIIRDGMPSKQRVIPKSIFRSSRDSILAFIGGYINGDGCIRASRDGLSIYICSSSYAILNQFKILLATLSIDSSIDESDTRRLNISPSNSHRLYSNIEPYLIPEKRVPKKDIAGRIRGDGIPSRVVVDFLKSRYVKMKTYNKNRPKDKTGAIFINDAGDEVFIEGGWGNTFRHHIGAKTPFLYDRHKKGMYAEHLRIIKKISPRLYSNMMNLFKNEYKFESIKSIELEGKDQPTYDLSMENSKSPWFVANSIIVHNSFWRWDESVETINAQKYRALGISEALLSGDATYSTLDASMSIFVEQLKSYRGVITREIFYDKIFPSIATANDYVKSGYETTGALREKHKRDHYNRRNMVLCSDDSHDFKIGANSFDAKNLIMPTITWTKTLAPVGDQAALDMMKELNEAGLPVPMAAMAAAGGMNIDEIFSNMDDELALRKELSKYNKKLDKYPVSGGGDSGGGGYEANARFMQSLASKPTLKPSKGKLFSRTFDERMDIHDKNHKGKFRSQSAKGNKIYKEKYMRKMAETLGRIRDKEAHKERESYKREWDREGRKKVIDMKPSHSIYGV